MSAVEIDPSLIRALQARAQGEDDGRTAGKAPDRRFAPGTGGLPKAVKAFRARPGGTAVLADVENAPLDQAVFARLGSGAGWTR